MELLVLGNRNEELNVEDGPVLILKMGLKPRPGKDVSPPAQEAGDGAWGRHPALWSLRQSSVISETLDSQTM